MMIRLDQQEQKRVCLWEKKLSADVTTSPESSAISAENSSCDVCGKANFIDIGDNLRNLMRLPKIGRRGWELKGINLWQQYQT
jgi:hypothetical protein